MCEETSTSFFNFKESVRFAGNFRFKNYTFSISFLNFVADNVACLVSKFRNIQYLTSTDEKI